MCLAAVLLPCYGVDTGENTQSHWVDLCTGHSYLQETLSLGLILTKGQVSKVNLYSKLRGATAPSKGHLVGGCSASSSVGYSPRKLLGIP